ncbi:MAG: hypothetical protein AUG44_05020 [Actinobacteria bacterium 13_1_20CM_3_71_11]|nr:MAG: hypothetical protein AUG44_05020 [Actinobacteria bacterium 13_1_20CM_3_71_11]
MHVISKIATTAAIAAALMAAGTLNAVGAAGRPVTSAPQIWLRSRVFDPLAEPAAARATLAGGAYLVQFQGVPVDSQRQQIRRLGGRVGAYLPDFAPVPA